MTDFRFRAPDLFNATARAQTTGTVLHDAPGAGEMLARSKRCALWLQSEMTSCGLTTEELDADEGGWMIAIPAKNGSALAILNGGESINDYFDLVLVEIGSAGDEMSRAEQVIKKALEATSSVTDLTITQ